MASCPKCGKPKIKKRKTGPRVCKRCGALPDLSNRLRTSPIEMVQHEPR